MKLNFHSNNVAAFIATIFILFLLGGCVSTKQKFLDNMMAQGVKRLTASEVKELFSDATESHSSSKYTAITYYSADGKVKGTAQWEGGEASDEGVWRVDESGSICGKYHGRWSKSGEQCFAVYPGKAKDEYTWLQTAGTPPKSWPDGIMQIKVTPGM